MFGNFLYFIIVLLIYSTAPISRKPESPLFESLELFLALTAVFAMLARIQFYRLEKRIAQDSFSLSDQQFNSLVTRYSVLAVILFAADIYWLNLPSYLTPHFTLVPTIQTLIFIGIFVGYLAIVWGSAYHAYRLLYNTELSWSGYVGSNISFSLPVLFPWLLLSLVSDIIHALPFETPAKILSTPAGEIAFFLFFLLITVIIAPVMIQKFWRCRRLEDSWERYRIEMLCRRAGLEYNDILYWPIFEGRMITAGVMGLMKRFRYILVTKALLSHLSMNEIEAVIAHEIGHVKKRHLLLYLLFFMGYMLLSYAVFDIAVYGMMYIEPLYRAMTELVSFQTAHSLIIGTASVGIFLIYFRYIFGYFMRNFERQADTYVYTLFDSAAPLISTFEKITLHSGQSPDKPNWHHFSVSERVDYLKKCEYDRTWIVRQDKKVRKGIVSYLVAVLVFSSLGIYFNTQALESTLLREIGKNPRSASLYELLGDMYYTRKDYQKTAQAYEKSLELDADNPKVLNNLAWLYATSEDRHIRDSERAVNLAQRAVSLSAEPHIWDTLAESYYANKEYENSVFAGKKALELAKHDKSYYENQLKKFMRAVIESRGRIAI